MVDAKACIPAPCVPEIIPEGVDLLVGVERAQGIRPALRDQAMKGAPCLGAKKRIIKPSFRLIDVELCWYDVVVTGKDNWRVERDQFGELSGPQWKSKTAKDNPGVSASVMAWRDRRASLVKKLVLLRFPANHSSPE
jgi:hypothetical protein